MNGTIMTLANAHASRPLDQRYPDIHALHAAAQRQRAQSAEVKQVQLRDLDVIAMGDSVAIQRRDSAGRKPAIPSWRGLSHLCREAGAPPSYLRTLPSPLMADCIRTGLARSGDAPDRRLLVSLPDTIPGASHDALALRAITSDSYARIWHADVTGWGVRLAGELGWGAPTIFRSASGAQTWGEEGAKAETYYLSDHDVLFALVDDRTPVESHGTQLFRGVIVTNDETGEGSVTIHAFLYDMICANHILWGTTTIAKASIRHVGRAGSRMAQAVAQLRGASHEPASAVLERVQAARGLLLADTREDVASKVYGMGLGLTRGVIEDAQIVAETTPRYGDPRSAWAVAQGLTEVSQRGGMADDRMRIDSAAARVLSLTGF